MKAMNVGAIRAFRMAIRAYELGDDARAIFWAEHGIAFLEKRLRGDLSKRVTKERNKADIDAREQARKAALSKLTPDERRILGLL